MLLEIFNTNLYHISGDDSLGECKMWVRQGEQMFGRNRDLLAVQTS